ncbi:pyridoxal phosphate-dependent aminotransferase [Leptospira sp. 2 VSF19]|uniref:alanine transaminase n=1 Tax=Leptospira soteropolitanensis TaxID=2950025 RepID=A0AAW5V8Z8_9LEPT|nr:pyridoxal phosphate-dependent aminotransferase [Leptospira soteropolitanensis]MCW7491334.1 pyridoxal phosphate-dependent aminotransferase [Leptospira soteropolitanensis]MCW7498919.1 pyridoxal phosphate-dependent aminotransferase [Leptospira soteropolitanensis]MCW7521489.1 pyridoxal phosphate-dependent aminotransferase [Leptospira soteropolitanensis]MCW7525022.1 pyridoxal phosphate-dependent aminotransferase [Leptospira soteropolitanensis]MCW7528890.1 pyridoxal phosphate-dependent aminotrans
MNYFPFAFSNRFSLLGDINLENKIHRTKQDLELSGNVILDLTNSNPTKLGLEFPPNALSHIFSSLDLSQYDPIPEGLNSAREILVSEYSNRKIKTHTNDFILTSSTSEAYSYIFKLFTNPGDEVLTPNPGYPLFSFLIGFENLKEVHYPLKENTEIGQWTYSAETIANCISTKTKLIVLVSPANPTGSRTTAKFWKEWEELGIQIPILLDEVFVGYEFSGEPHYIPNSPNFPLFICNGFSKLLALPGFKLGWILNKSPEIYHLEIQKKLGFIADTYLSVNSLVQLATPELLPWKSMIQNRIRTRIMRNLSMCNLLLAENPKIKNKSIVEAGWYFLFELDLDRRDEDLILEILINTKVFLHPGSWYGFSHNRCFLVISLISEEDTLRQGLEGILSYLK